MRLETAHFANFKRITDTRIEGLPESAKLVVLAGPNGSAKSSIFDGFRTWHGARVGAGFGWDVGNSLDAGQDRLDFAGAMQALRIERSVIRLIDRDLRSDPEVEVLRRSGTRVLSRRHIESYLYDDEVLSVLCLQVGQPDRSRMHQLRRGLVSMGW